MTPKDLKAIFSPDVRRSAYTTWKASLYEEQNYCHYRGQGFACGGGSEYVRPLTGYGDEPESYVMCARHAEDYRKHWNSMWNDYYTMVSP